MPKQQIFFIEVKPEERLTLDQLFKMTFESEQEAVIALAKVNGSQNAVIFPPDDFSWHSVPPKGEVFAYPPQEHRARFVKEEGRLRWERVRD